MGAKNDCGLPLFACQEEGAEPTGYQQPLAARLRPHTLDGVVGQDHLCRQGAALRRLVEGNSFGSLLFYGPPGCGKTTLAEVIARETGSRFVKVNAVSSNVAELREHLAMARLPGRQGTILFIDELHRFNKAQQDLLLPDVEEGTVRLIGATTYNPGFYVIPALVSRAHLFKLEPIAVEIIRQCLLNALTNADAGLGGLRVTVEGEALDALARAADGDLRRGYNLLEALVVSRPIGATISVEDTAVFLRERQIRYDAGEDEHYDTISAFIKSIRGGDPDAAVYWLAKMLVGGEDPRYIARRLVILASEDVGMADPRALPLAVAGYQASEVIGLPECEINLVHVTVFLATCPKSNRAYLSLLEAKRSIREDGLQPVPVWLRDKQGKRLEQKKAGEEYLYSHDYPEAISGQPYLMQPLKLYSPSDHGAEKAVRERLQHWRRLAGEKSGTSQDNDHSQ